MITMLNAVMKSRALREDSLDSDTRFTAELSGRTAWVQTLAHSQPGDLFTRVTQADFRQR